MADTLLSVGLGDDAGASKRANIFLPGSMTLAQIQGWSDLYIALLDAVTDGLVTGAEVTFGLTLPGGLKGSAAADSTVRRGADFTFANASRYKWGTYIPTWALSLIDTGNINVSDTDAAAFLSAYTNGLVVSSVTYQPTNGYTDDLTTLSNAKEAFRK